MLSISPFELLAIVLFAVPTLVWCLQRGTRAAWAVAALVSIALAAVLTPADLLSTLLFSLTFLAMFAAGWGTSKLSAT